MNDLGTLLLETERVYLRRIEENDYIDMYQNWASLEECSKYFPWSPANDINQYKSRVSAWIKQYENNQYYQWVIEWKQTHEVIGIINLHDLDILTYSAETSYILSPKYWGNGIMTEVLSRILAFAFHDLKLNSVQADVFEGNISSEKVLQKCGMKRIGIENRKYCKNSTYINSIQYKSHR